MTAKVIDLSEARASRDRVAAFMAATGHMTAAECRELAGLILLDGGDPDVARALLDLAGTR